MTEWFFSSDHHFGHANIIRYCNRPFWSGDDPDVTAMNEALVTYWNETVGPNDVVWYLGDFAMGKIAETLPIVGRLNGAIHLVPGNHDRCWTGHSKKAKVEKARLAYLDAGFETVQNNIVRFRTYDLCHFPFSGDSHENDRYTDYRPEPRGLPLFHGHVHDSWKVNGQQVNVGCDVWDYRPVHIDQLFAALEA